MTYYFSDPNTARRVRHAMQRTMEPEWQQQEFNVTFPIDVKAEEDAYVITALIPGIKAEDLNIQIVNETLSIQGELVNDLYPHCHTFARPGCPYCHPDPYPNPDPGTGFAQG